MVSTRVIVLAGAILGALFGSMILAQTKYQSAVLTWDTLDATATGVHVFRGSLDCDTQLGPLQPLVDSTGQPVTLGIVTTYTDNTVPDVTGNVCYELTAFNSGGESVHSVRATKQVTGSTPPPPPVPAVPTGLAVVIQ
jgi:hypothetical protein